MKIGVVDDEIRLIPYYPNYDVADGRGRVLLCADGAFAVTKTPAAFGLQGRRGYCLKGKLSFFRHE